MFSVTAEAIFPSQKRFTKTTIANFVIIYQLTILLTRNKHTEYAVCIIHYQIHHSYSSINSFLGLLDLSTKMTFKTSGNDMVLQLKSFSTEGLITYLINSFPHKETHVIPKWVLK